jgi:hypothetical protein
MGEWELLVLSGTFLRGSDIGRPTWGGMMAGKRRGDKQSDQRDNVAQRTREAEGSRNSTTDSSLGTHLRSQMTEAKTNLQEGFGGFRDQTKDAGKRVKRRFTSGARRWEREGVRSIRRPPIGTPPSGIPPTGRPPSGLPPSGVPPEIERRMKASRTRQRD